MRDLGVLGVICLGDLVGYGPDPVACAELSEDWDLVLKGDWDDAVVGNDSGWRFICNVGAVGQPRDGDWRACYALFDGRQIRFRRVWYDLELTVKKIQATPELVDFTGQRLRLGR